ncbi:UNKNOWN [Stylonychia lemnae]|uniref:Uncharacterized protein n=1 Tax=Stylonychia lemnae TaxID=5949 RepID=A0A078A9W0_STYLE|nr:UNKNOWN [Stylonychia lemnae]|eukprot:CDW78681.1 UNKNOWN [Stylonychia lemnae]
MLIALLIVYCQAFQLEVLPKEERVNTHLRVRENDFAWLLDIPRILLEYLIVMVLSPFFILPSFFLNNQEIWVATIYKFLYLPVVRLSGYAS